MLWNILPLLVLLSDIFSWDVLLAKWSTWKSENRWSLVTAVKQATAGFRALALLTTVLYMKCQYRSTPITVNSRIYSWLCQSPNSLKHQFETTVILIQSVPQTYLGLFCFQESKGPVFGSCPPHLNHSILLSAGNAGWVFRLSDKGALLKSTFKTSLGLPRVSREISLRQSV